MYQIQDDQNLFFYKIKQIIGGSLSALQFHFYLEIRMNNTVLKKIAILMG